MGKQLLLTGPSPLLSGASTASLSLWIRVNPGSSVAGPGGVQLFGDAAGKLSVTLSGAGNVGVAWSSSDGTTGGRSSWAQALTPGVVHHLAATWADGAQHYFLDGALVASDTRRGTLGAPGSRPPSPFRLGSDVAGVDVTLDEPTLWVGYALTASDVVDLRDRSGPPGLVAPSSVALDWSLDGPNGVAARVGDPGLVDASSTGLEVASIAGAAPSYEGGGLSYGFVAGGCSASVPPSGQGILFTFHDGSGNASNLRSLASPDETQSVVLSGDPAGGGFSLAFGGQATATIPAIRNPPASSFTWNFTLDAPGAHDFAANLCFFAFNTQAALYEFFDGPTRVGSATLDHRAQANTPAAFNDASTQLAGGPLGWTPLGRFTFSGTSASIRLSCPASPDGGDNAKMYADAIRVASTDGATVRVIGPSVPPAVVVPPNTPDAQYWLQFSYGQEAANVGADNYVGNGLGAGDFYSVDPAAVRSALAALPGIGAGNVAVTGSGSARDPLVVIFQGSLGLAPQPLLTATDPAVSVARVIAGGAWPQARINGGPPVRLANPYYGSGHGNGLARPRTNPPYLPAAYFPLIQSAEAVRYEKINTHLNMTSRQGWGGTSGKAGYGGSVVGLETAPQIANGPSATATWARQGLPAGSYRLSVTWPGDPTYSGAVTYTVADRAGTVLATVNADQRQPPPGPADRGFPWLVLGTFTLAGVSDDLTITLSNASTNPLMTADAVRFERVSPDASLRIHPGDVVTYSAGAGWATSMAGPAPAAVDSPVANDVGGTLYPAFVEAPKAMGLGWNINEVLGDNGCLPYANLARFVQAPLGNALTSDADGYPITFRGSSNPSDIIGFPMASPTRTVQGDGMGWPNLPAGDYTVLWDGASDVTFYGGAEVAGRAIYPAPGGVDNRRVWTLDNDGNAYAPSVSVAAHSTSKNPDGSFNVDVRNLRVYPPGIDPANPPLFLPQYVAKLAGARSLRFLDPSRAINGNPTEFGDYDPPASRLSRFSPVRAFSVPVVEVRAPQGPAWFDPTVGSIYQCTTSRPHGLQEGQYIGFNGSPGVAHFSDGSSVDLSTYYFGFAHVISPTVFSYQYGQQAGQGRTPIAMTNVLTGGNLTVQMYAGVSMPLSEMIALCNQVGADLYLNTAIPATDDCLTKIGATVAAKLKPGSKFRVEFANEAWNSGQSPNNYCLAASYGHGLDPSGYNYIPFYCTRAAHHWAVIGAAMAAAGRGGDLIRVMGSAHIDPGITGSLARYCATANPPIAFDELATAPYVENGPSAFCNPSAEPDQEPALAAFTPDQVLDLLELFFVHTGHETEMPAHRRSLDEHGFTGVRLITYEGGPDQMIPSSGTPARWGERSHAIHRHPRFYHFLLRYLQMMQDAGTTLYHFYYLSGEDGHGGGFSMWTAYVGTQQADATGDPTLDAANLATPDRTDLVASQVGGAWGRWASLATPPAPPRSPGPRRILPGRNGQLRAVGYFRGMSRPTR